MSITNTIHTIMEGKNISIAAGGTYIFDPIDLNTLKINGYFAIQAVISGSGTAKFEYMECFDDNPNLTGALGFFKPTSDSGLIKSGVSATSGAGGDGKVIYSFIPPATKWIRLQIVETGGASAITVSLTLIVV